MKVTRKKGQRGFTALATLVFVLWFLYIAAVLAGVVTVIHFVLKYW